MNGRRLILLCRVRRDQYTADTGINGIQDEAFHAPRPTMAVANIAAFVYSKP